MQAGLQTRYTIYEILKALKLRTVSFDNIFTQKVINNNFNMADRKMIHTVVLNSMRYHFYVDDIINKFSKKINKFSDSYILLLSSITQLIVLNFKDFAVINSTVELTKDYRIKSPTKFINGVLRNISRNKFKLLNINPNFSNLPLWFTKRLSFWNQRQKITFMNTICKEPNLHLVFKDKKDIRKITCQNSLTSNHSIVIKESLPIKQIKGFKEGLWWIQDFSAMLPLYLTNNIKNKKAVDLCAAPGGKTFQLLNYGAKVKAVDKNKQKAKILQQNLNRLNFDCKIEIKDMQKLKNNHKFDLVVLDAPCSSVGTIRRHPEIFFRKQIPDFKKILKEQNKLLKKTKFLLKKNGILIYIVCSFLHEEGKDQINNFLKQNKNFSLIKYKANQNKLTQNFIDKDGYYYMTPSCLNNGLLVDGFFSAKLIKNE